ncbi:MAG: hypothetical protein EBT59_09905 [Betaproteobacteria bacterium]|nr:hypothetical protein [Betaproteobacteria bacterium]
MNKFFNIRWVLGLALSLSLCAASLTEALAQSTPAASTAAADAPAKAEAPAEAKAAAPVQAGADAKAEDKAQASEAKAEAAPTPPAPNKGDTAWMMVATLLVVMMAVPGLALFYGGLVMVWFWDGPDAITDEKTLESVTAAAGWLWQKGALDFAGGTVVHINAGVAGLVGAYLIGKRIGFGKEAMAPHSLPLTLVGACLLWVGWFGFNAGSNLEANGVAGMAFINTLVAGLVGITPACGFVGPMGAIVIGLISGLAALWGVGGLKRLLGADDSLDVFGVHGVAGIVGALLTGVFAAPSLGGSGIFDYVANAASADYSIGSQVWVQAQAVLVTVLWSAIVSFIAYKIVDVVIGLRVSDEQEREGLDIASHGESAYRY